MATKKNKILTTTYGGKKKNPLSDACYYCYTIYDPEYDKYYSGAKTVSGSADHGLLTRYFTSSRVQDFKDRLKANPERFQYYVEYFSTPEEAFSAEMEYHKKMEVHSSNKFYNIVGANSTDFNTIGTVVCVSDNGETYVVSKDAFYSGSHKSVSAGTRLVICRKTKSNMRVTLEEYDPKKHIPYHAGKVTAYDTITGKTLLVDAEVFHSDSRYVSPCEGKVIRYDTVKGKNVFITKAMAADPRYVDKNKTRAEHSKGMITVYSIVDKKHVAIPTEQYATYKNNYLHGGIKNVYLCDGKYYTNKRLVPKGKKVKIFERKDFHKIKGVISYE